MTATASAPSVGATRSYFYVWMATACAAIAVLGFAPTYFQPLVQGTFAGSPLVHLHGLVFFGWTAFVIYQTWLVASGQTANHRETGLIGVALAATMTILGMTVAIVAAQHGIAAGYPAESKAFLIVPPGVLVIFAPLVAFAIANVKRPEWHKRLLLVATISLLEAPIARWFLVALAPPDAPANMPPPVAIALMPGLISDLLIVAGMIYDWRTRGRPHPAYVIGLAAMLVMQFAREPLSRTPLWDAVATWLVSIAG